MLKRFLKWLGFHVHEWGTWGRKGYGATVSGREVLSSIFQARHCKTCGKEQTEFT